MHRLTKDERAGSPCAPSCSTRRGRPTCSPWSSASPSCRSTRLNAIHEDAPFDRDAVEAELADLAAWLDLDLSGV